MPELTIHWVLIEDTLWEYLRATLIEMQRERLRCKIIALWECAECMRCNTSVLWECPESAHREACMRWNTSVLWECPESAHIQRHAWGAIQVFFESALRMHVGMHAWRSKSSNWSFFTRSFLMLVVRWGIIWRVSWDCTRTGCSSLRSDLVSRSDLHNVSPDS